MTAPAPARSRALRRVLIGIVVLLVLMLVADRGADYAAEQVAANKIQSSQHLPSQPDVSVVGFPFLTQLAAGKYDEITVTASNVPIGSDAVGITIAGLTVVLHDLTVSGNFSRFHAATGTADARISYAELGRRLGAIVAYAGNGRIKATKSVTVLGTTASASITTRPALVNDALSFTATSINGLNGLSPAVVTAVKKVFDVSISLAGIPFGVQVRGIAATASGVHIALTGSDLSYGR